MNSLKTKILGYLNSFDDNQEDVDFLLKRIDWIEDFFSKSNDSEAYTSLFELVEIAINELNLFAASLSAIIVLRSAESENIQIPLKIQSIIDSYNKIQNFDNERLEKNKTSWLDFIIVSSGDLRGVLISIAENLYSLRQIKSDKIISASDVIFATEVSIPLTHRLGIYKLKSEIEDLVFMYRFPKIYSEIDQKIKASAAEREDFVLKFINPIIRQLDDHKLKYKIKWRTKSVASIYSKMLSQEIPFEKVFDLFAIRIITDSPSIKEKADCWHVFSVVTNIYKSDTKRLRDWVSKPRENGYESLHITVETTEGRFVEVQIRSHRMDDEAENGMAAHWRYKGGKSEDNVNKYLLAIRKALESKKEITDANQPTMVKELFAFTPTGELKKLQAGATVLDFAFSIHSEVGIRCSGARINGILKPIKQTLSNGDQVEIITNKNQKPTTDWLNFVASSRAKARIRKALDERKSQEAANGKEILIRRLKNWKLDFNQDMLDLLASHYKHKNISDLYIDIFQEKIELTEVKKLLLPQSVIEEKHELSTKPDDSLKHISSQDALIVEDIDRVNYRLSGCCNPVPGDEIFGFVTIAKGISIHRANCPNAPSMHDRYPYRIIPARWKNQDEKSSFRATIFLKGFDRPGILMDITKIINNHASLLQVNINTKGRVFQGKVVVGIKEKSHLELLLSKLHSYKEITDVYRLNN